MDELTTIQIKRETLERFNAIKNTSAKNADVMLNRLMDNYEENTIKLNAHIIGNDVLFYPRCE